MAALLGLEYLGRKRADRKIRKDVGKQFDRQQKATSTEFSRADTRAKSTAQEVSEVRAQQQAFEAKLTANERRIQTPQPRAEQRPATEIKLPRPESLKPLPPLEQMPVAEHVVQQTERLKKPEAVLEHMSVAAEQNIPVEAVYERRHEVKKEQPQSGGGGAGGPSQPTLLADSLPGHLPNVKLPSGVPTWQKAAQPGANTEAYKQAVKRGLWGAIALLIFIGILFLIART